jgi:hypothetical protein
VGERLLRLTAYSPGTRVANYRYRFFTLAQLAGTGSITDGQTKPAYQNRASALHTPSFSGSPGHSGESGVPNRNVWGGRVEG